MCHWKKGGSPKSVFMFRVVWLQGVVFFFCRRNKRGRFAHHDGLIGALSRAWRRRSLPRSKPSKLKRWASFGNMPRQVAGRSFTKITLIGGCFLLMMAPKMSSIYVVKRMWQPYVAMQSGWKVIMKPWDWQQLLGAGTLPRHVELSRQRRVWLGLFGMFVWPRCAEAFIYSKRQNDWIPYKHLPGTYRKKKRKAKDFSTTPFASMNCCISNFHGGHWMIETARCCIKSSLLQLVKHRNSWENATESLVVQSVVNLNVAPLSVLWPMIFERFYVLKKHSCGILVGNFFCLEGRTIVQYHWPIFFKRTLLIWTPS